MLKKIIIISFALLNTALFSLSSMALLAQEITGDEVVDLSGISIIGNNELPKTLFIVPWKDSQVGVATDIDSRLDDGLGMVDKEQFQRELEYYQLATDSFETIE